jgi:hypothetical protein
MKLFLVVFLVIIISITGYSKDKKVISIYGYVEDAVTHEKLIACYILDSISKQAVITNSFGYFSLTIKEGSHIITAQNLGYVRKRILLNCSKDTSIILGLNPAPAIKIDEVKVTASRSEAVLSQPQMSQMNLSANEVKKLPRLLGEADVMHSIQVLPGIQAANERSTGISVRGGSIDQNLFLLDDAPVYQISHIGGFYSVFNADAVKDVKIFKGDIPANYGGRLSSVVDIRLRDGNMKNYEVSGGVGFISSNLNIEGPILKDRVSFIASGKVAYIGYLYKKVLNDNMNLNFYDFNCKLNAIINSNSRIYVSSYIGGDHIENNLNSNRTLSLRWNYIYNPRLFGNISFIYSNYGVQSTNGSANEDYFYKWQSGIATTMLKADYNFYFNDHISIDFGISSSLNSFNPGELSGSKTIIGNIEKSNFSKRVTGKQNALDHAIYAGMQQKISDCISLKYGFRACLYQNLGNNNWVYRLNNYQVTDSFFTSKNSIYSHDFKIEPRLGFNYRVTKTMACKLGYSYTTQQSQLLMKTNGGGPLDIWFPSGINIKPQTATQYSIGFVQYFAHNLFEFSAESYYKNMNNIRL